MKRLFFILASIVLVSSCLDDGSSTTSEYTLVADFQYGAGVSFKSDSTWFNPQSPEGFGYDALNFYYKLDANKVMHEGGFILSCAQMPASGNTERLPNDWRAYVTTGTQPIDNIYTVYCQNSDSALMPEHDIKFAYKENGTCTMIGCYMVNTVSVVNAVKEHFKTGDRLSVKMTGFLDGTKTGDVEFVLADYSAQKDSIVSRWTPVALDGLGSVDYVDFEVVTTNPNVPTSFCMDEFSATVEISY